MLFEVVLNTGEVLAAAARIGIVGEEAVVSHIGVALSPVTARLISAVVAHLPVAASSAFCVRSRTARIRAVRPHTTELVSID